MTAVARDGESLLQGRMRLRWMAHRSSHFQDEVDQSHVYVFARLAYGVCQEQGSALWALADGGAKPGGGPVLLDAAEYCCCGGARAKGLLCKGS